MTKNVNTHPAFSMDSTSIYLLNYPLCRNQDRLLDIVYSWRRVARGFAGLHGVRYLSITEMVSALLEMKELDSNATN